MCDSFAFAQETPTLDDSPTIPIMALPGCNDEEDDRQVNFLPGMDVKKPDTARRPTSFITDTDVSNLIAQDAFPSFILDAIEVGSIQAGTKAREARLGELSPSQSAAVHPTNIYIARSQQSRSVSDGTWQPYNKRPFTQRRASLDAAPSRPPLNFTHTAPPDLPGYAPMARSASLTTAPAGAPPTFSKSHPPVLPIAPQRASTFSTSSSKRYRALQSPATSTCRPATPLHSIPETPRDLDVAPEGNWTLRRRYGRSSKLRQSRSAPNMKVSKRPVEPEGLKRTLSGLDRRDGSDSKKKYLSVALQMRRGSAPLDTYLAFHNGPVQPIPKTLSRSSSLVRSSHIQSLSKTAPNKPTDIQNSLKAEDIPCWPPLVIRPKRSGCQPVPAATLRSETPTASTMRGHGTMPEEDAPGTTIPPRPVKSRQRIIRAEKKEKRSRVICFPPECTPCLLTPDSDALTFSSILTEEREKEEEDTEDVWQAVGEAEKWVWPDPPSKTLTPPRILVTSFTNPFRPEPTVYDNKNDTTPKASRSSIYRGMNGSADLLSKIELRLDLAVPMEKEGEGKKFKSWAKGMRRKWRA